MPLPPIEKKPGDAANLVHVRANSKGIEVRALRPGFYQNSRKVEGDIFTVPSLDRVGTWMECTDRTLEKKHQELMKQNKDAGK